MASRNATDPPLPASGTRYGSQPARPEGAQPVVGGAASVRPAAGSGRGWARTGRCTRIAGGSLPAARVVVEVAMSARYDAATAPRRPTAKLWITSGNPGPAPGPRAGDLAPAPAGNPSLGPTSGGPYGSMIVWKSYGSRWNPIRS
jgi:hypothetical protein